MYWTDQDVLDMAEGYAERAFIQLRRGNPQAVESMENAKIMARAL